MIHEFDDVLRADPERFTLAQKAAKLLDEYSNGSIFRATARWRMPDNGHAVVSVDLREPGGAAVQRSITPDERDDPRELKWRTGRIWGDLLEDSLNRHVKRWQDAGAFSPEYSQG